MPFTVTLGGTEGQCPQCHHGGGGIPWEQLCSLTSLDLSGDNDGVGPSVHPCRASLCLCSSVRKRKGERCLEWLVGFKTFKNYKINKKASSH